MNGARPTLHLGVLVQPYRAWELVTGKNGRKRRKQGATRPVDTGEVAEILEQNYGIMEAFAREDVHGKDIVRSIESTLESALKNLVGGGPANPPWGDGMHEIETAFRTFIDSREAERVGIPNTPTKAALDGVNHRLAHPYRKSNPRRPSFRDTGLYVRSFRAWMG